MTSRRIHRLCLSLVAAALVAPAPTTTPARAAYLGLGTSNTSNAPTTLTGNSTNGPELTVVNSNAAQPALKARATGAQASAFGVIGVLTATGPVGNSAAVRGQNNATNQNGYGVWGSHAGSGTGVYGTSAYGTGGSFAGRSGVLGTAIGANGDGVIGVASNGADARGVGGFSSSGIGVYGQSLATNASGVRGVANSGSYASGVSGTSSSGAGVYGSSSGGIGQGVSGYSSATNGNGVIGQANNGAGAHGVYGKSSSGTGVSGSSTALAGVGVRGEADIGPWAVGVYGGSSNGYGVYGLSSGGTGVSGVYGYSSDGTGVEGSSGATNGIGVHGAGNAYGVYGSSTNGYGVYGASGAGWAGYFDGNVRVNGTLSKTAGSFRIDHPLDPAHEYLQHSFVESPDMKDVYDGVVTTDGRGFATVTMPPWFQALNRSFRYQLTIIGTRGWNARVVDEVAGNRFTIQSDLPRVRVSWQVTGIRHDPYAVAHRIQVEVRKPPLEQGLYVYPQGTASRAR
jgi:hypothetical protein